MIVVLDLTRPIASTEKAHLQDFVTLKQKCETDIDNGSIGPFVFKI